MHFMTKKYFFHVKMLQCRVYLVIRLWYNLVGRVGPQLERELEHVRHRHLPRLRVPHLHNLKGLFTLTNRDCLL